MIARNFRAAFIAAVLIAVPLSPQGPAASAQDAAGDPAIAMGPGAPIRGISVILDHAYRHGVQLPPATRVPASVQAESPDAALEGLFLRYARAVGFGQITPAAAGMAWEIGRAEFDADATRAAFEGASLTAALATLPPPHRAYGALVRALARYRAIAQQGGWPRVPDGRLLSRGMSDPRVPTLRRRLAAEGVEKISNLEHVEFDERLEAAVIRFQRRHGLRPDGIVGPRTRAALNVPVDRRVWQIVVNMERWRWLPRRMPVRRLEVNTAAARLKVLEGPRLALGMRVVVGSPRHPTPVLESEIKAVILNPSWYVPDSIWRKEIFPKLRRDPNYLAAKQMEISGRFDDPQGLRIHWSAQRMPPPGVRIRQTPGPFNALGRVKFHTPNRFDVYLHDTPQRAFFKRADRALSHGCIRLERPDRLLAYLFPDTTLRPELASSQTPLPWKTQTLTVAQPLPVFTLYWTAFVARDGSVQFRNDVYGHDSRMVAALSRPGRGIQQAFLASGCPQKQNET